MIGNLAFCFDFYSSKWNKSGKQVEVEAGFYIHNKKWKRRNEKTVQHLNEYQGAKKHIKRIILLLKWQFKN